MRRRDIEQREQHGSSRDIGGLVIPTAGDFDTASDKQPVFNVRNFGATPDTDGVQDVAFAIQAAHDALPPGGGVLYFPYGLYLSGAVTFTKPVILLGDGTQSSVIAPASASAAMLTFATGSEGSRAVGLGFSGAASGVTPAGSVFVTATDYVVIETCRFEQYGTAVLLSGKSCRVSGCRFDAAGVANAIGVQANGQRSLIQHNTFDSAALALGLTAVYANTFDTWVVDNFIRQHARGVRGQLTLCTVVENDFVLCQDGAGGGIGVWNSLDLAASFGINGNIFDTCDTGVKIDGANTDLFSVQENIFSTCTANVVNNSAQTQHIIAGNVPLSVNPPVSSTVLTTAGPIGLSFSDSLAQAHVSTNTYFVYLGRAPRPLSSIVVQWREVSAAVTVTWAEIAICTGAPVWGLPGGPSLLTTRGFVDISGIVTSAGWNQNTISVSGIEAGDDLWLAIGLQATTVGSFRSLDAADAAQSGLLLVGAVRPSTMAAGTSVAVAGAAIKPPFGRVKV